MWERLLRQFEHLHRPKNFSDQVEVLIATKNSASWIGLLVDEYARLGIRPIILLDGYSQDHTERVLTRKRVRYARIYPEYPRVEAIIKELPRYTGSEWILRMDDDEFPSRRLVRGIEQRLRSVGTPVIGIPRRWVRLGMRGHCEYSNHRSLRWLNDQMDIQWRLFKPKEVRYTTEIHTAGFRVTDYELFPDDEYLVHFDWVLRSFEQRAAKLDNYEKQEPGSGYRFRDLYLWESAPIASHAFTEMETREFNRLAARLARNAPANAS